MRTLFGAMGALLFVGCTSSSLPASIAATPNAANASGDYRSVHIDTIAPGKVSQFESGRREWLAELRRANATDGRGVFLQVGESRFFTLRSFATFGDFDTRGAAIEKSLAPVPKAAGTKYDQACDTALVFPHTSEIWRVDGDLAYAPNGNALTERTAACGRIVVDDVRPDPESEERYSRANAEMNRALAEAHYPLTRVTFETMYGAGHVVTLWLARSREDLDAAPSVESVVAKVRGATRGAELTAACDASVVHREIDAFVVRHDLTQE